MKFDSKLLQEMSNAARAGALRAIRSARSGHVGIALGAADIITAVYANHLRLGDWKSRDRFVLSAGHGSALLYSVLKLRGFDLPPLETFRKSGGLPGHPEYGIPGVEATTGPLGQGLANAVGIALAAKMRAARGIGPEFKVYCLCSDGDLMEGVAQEAIAFAGLHELNNLILVWDDNGVSIDGKAMTGSLITARMFAAGWEIRGWNSDSNPFNDYFDGNNLQQIEAALNNAETSDTAKPKFIRMKTTIGLGSSAAGTARAHGMSLGDAELAELIEKFESEKGEKLWKKMPRPASAIPSAVPLAKRDDAPVFDRTDMASTRELSGRCLEFLTPREPLLVGGSADLSESTNTKVLASRDIAPDDFSGNFVNYGVREHAMAAIMNGLSLSGFKPYGGTFLAFSDYMRPAVRLSALSKLPVIYVFSHDSIALGEDGPTHQPVEQLASLRMIPNMNVFRPCNAAETAACWEAALAETARPSCIVLSRQKFAQIETPAGADISRGAYLIWKPEAGNRKPETTIVATGSEVPLAVEVAKKLKNAQVASMPSLEKFRSQQAEYKNEILQGHIVAIEAGATSAWFEFADAVVGIDSFGESGGGAEVYKKFGFDADAIAAEIIKKQK
ncbi:MAG: transketolase [Rickettsiales bacterium]|jgi:transketolase|nr:transketolase [Rickettsiales bacterium]